MPDVSDHSYRYTFAFPDGQNIVCQVNLDPVTLDYLPPVGQELPDWAQNGSWLCTECELRPKPGAHCQLIQNIAQVVVQFRDVASFDRADVTVESAERTVSQRQIPVQEALSSLLGLIMVTSGCPALDFLRPMTSLHLPFANLEETIFRAASTYLLAQYYRHKRGMSADWDLVKLMSIYRQIGLINNSLCEYLRQAVSQDANLNALIVLDTFGQMLTGSIETELAQFEHLFRPYLLEDS